MYQEKPLETIRQEILDSLSEHVGRPHTERTIKDIKITLDRTLRESVNNELLFDYGDIEVTGDESTGRVDINMSIQPTPSPYFVGLKVNLENTDIEIDKNGNLMRVSKNE